MPSACTTNYYLRIEIILFTKIVVYSQRFRSTHSADYKEAVSSLPLTETTTLDNGIRVASENNGSNTVSVGLWIDAGSRHEEANNNGVANLFRHAAFKGKAVEDAIESVGARLESFIGREQTAFVATCLPQHASKVVEILSNAITNPQLDNAAVESARKAVLREIDDAESNLQDLVFANLHAAAYQGTPLGQPLTGSEDNVKSISKQDLENHASTHFKGSRIVLAAAGGVNHTDLVQSANKNLGKLENTFDNQAPVLSKCRYTSSDVRVRDDDIPHAYIAIGVEGCGWNHDDYFPLEVVRHYLGSWDRTQISGVNHPLALTKYCDEGRKCR